MQNLDGQGNLYNLYLKVNQNEFQLTYARKGIFRDFNNVPVLVLYNGETITNKNNEITNFSFSKSDFPLKNIETNTTTYKKTQELSSLKLFKCIKLLYYFPKKIKNQNIKNFKIKNLENIFKEIYKRFIIPFYIPLLVLTNYILFYYSKENTKYNSLKSKLFL